MKVNASYHLYIDFTGSSWWMMLYDSRLRRRYIQKSSSEQGVSLSLWSLLEKVLQERQITFRDLTSLWLNLGPGSNFTTVRTVWLAIYARVVAENAQRLTLQEKALDFYPLQAGQIALGSSTLQALFKRKALDQENLVSYRLYLEDATGALFHQHIQLQENNNLDRLKSAWLQTLSQPWEAVDDKEVITDEVKLFLRGGEFEEQSLTWIVFFIDCCYPPFGDQSCLRLDEELKRLLLEQAQTTAFPNMVYLRAPSISVDYKTVKLL